MNTQPAFRISCTPFGSGRDPRAVTIHVHRVDGAPIGGAFGLRLVNDGLTLPELVDEMHRLVAQLGTEAPPAFTKAAPLSWPVVDGRIVFPEVPS